MQSGRRCRVTGNCSANEGQVREKYFHLCYSVVFVLCDKPTTVRGKWGSRHFGRAAVVSCFVFAFYFLRSEGKSRSPHPALQPLSLDVDHLERDLAAQRLALAPSIDSVLQQSSSRRCDGPILLLASNSLLGYCLLKASRGQPVACFEVRIVQ